MTYTSVRKLLNKHLLALGLVVVVGVAVYFRFSGVEWDQRFLLHPDERFLVMLVYDSQLPDTFSEYLNPDISTLNPFNLDRGFFVYGTFPLFLLKIISKFISTSGLTDIAVQGRYLSAVFDVGTVLLVFVATRLIVRKKDSLSRLTPLFASLFYAVSVLAIQQAHFFTVDSITVFFTTLSLLIGILISKITLPTHPVTRSALFKTIPFLLLAISFSLAIGSKLSSALLAPILGLSILIPYLRAVWKKPLHESITVTLWLVSVGVVSLSAAYLLFRLTNPYVFANNNWFDFTLHPQFVYSIEQLKIFTQSSSTFPPSVQWLSTKPIIFPLRNLIIYGLGIPLGVASIFGLGIGIITLLKRLTTERLEVVDPDSEPNTTRYVWSGLFLISVWVLFLFFYQSIQFVKTMRYFLPIYPFLAVFAAIGIVYILSKIQKPSIRYGLLALIIAVCLIWPISFSTIYTRYHSRVTASVWIYDNIPTNKILTCEHWDDCLPLTLAGYFSDIPIRSYTQETLHLYNPESPTKWGQIEEQLENADYIVISSSRLYGSIPLVPERYPITTEFYKQLFDESLGFTKSAEITSYPSIPVPCVLSNVTSNVRNNEGGVWCDYVMNDDASEEAFTVYDHPKVLIYKKQ